MNPSGDGRPSMQADSWSIARDVLALGEHHRSLLRPLFAGEEGVYPRFAREANGCRIVDEQGRTFIDWVSGTGCVLLGYRHPAVEAAVRKQFEAGPTLSLYHEVEVEVARALTEIIPCAERVGFGKHGSDALTAAVRIARAYTGREIILHHGFHGFQDWYACRYTNRPGLPHASAEHLHSFPYNDLPVLQQLVTRFRGRIAAILMEPMNIELPERGYLESVAEIARECGALLIFDEVWTAFRLGLGGAQERFGVIPDLACYGKPLANGMPLSAVVGRDRFMRLLPSVAYGMTYRDETFSLAACKALLDVVRSEPVSKTIEATGARIRREIESHAKAVGVELSVVGMDGRLSVEFAPAHGMRRERLLALFARECARQGVLTSGLIIPNYAHDQATIEQSLAVFRSAIDVIGAATRTPRAGDLGTPTSPGLDPLFFTAGQLDVVSIRTFGDLDVHGWLLVDDRAPDRVEFQFTDGSRIRGLANPRPDVAEAFQLGPEAMNCGFIGRLPRRVVAPHCDYQFQIQAFVGDRVVFQCDVLHRAQWKRPVLTGEQWLSIGL